MIYLIENTKNGKQYVGWTQRDVETRWNEHITFSKFRDSMLYRALRKYGDNNFKVSILEETNNIEREVYWIDKLDTYNNGYNMTLGGEGGSAHLGHKHTNETKEKLRKVHLGRKHTKEHREKVSKSLTGLIRGKQSDEHRKKLSESKKGMKMPIVVCPHCTKSGGAPAMKQWHFDNCKEKRTG